MAGQPNDGPSCTGNAVIGTIRLTMAQALVKYLVAQRSIVDDQSVPLVSGVWAIFGHGNVAGLGEALYHAKEELPTYRAHNEQGMAHAAIAYAKARNRRQLMACTTSIGPGATNMVTSAALAHVNRLPVIFLPGDVFATRLPDPVLQQIEVISDATVSANDCFRPVSSFFDRITRPEQLLDSLPRAMQVLTDPANCGPVTMALPQDVQTMAYEYPVSFFDKQTWRVRQPSTDNVELRVAVDTLMAAKAPLIIAGGGVHYANACETLCDFVDKHGIPVAETQGGKGAVPWNHPRNVGAIGVTGTAAANALAETADVVLCVGTRLQDFTTASRSIFKNPDVTIVGLNVCAFDSHKHDSRPLVADAQCGLQSVSESLGDWQGPSGWQKKASSEISRWNEVVDSVTEPDDRPRPSDMQVIGAVNRALGEDDTVVCAAGGLPGELHKLWRTVKPGGYHVEYGYSCMGYEIAGGLGVRMAKQSGDVCVMVGDGSYLMMNSEIATSVMLGQKLILVVLDNRGFGSINRLQQACGIKRFNNLLVDARHAPNGPPNIDFVAHARSLGAESEKVTRIEELEAAVGRAKSSPKTYAIVIETDPALTTEDGGAWWDVAVPETSTAAAVVEARKNYEQQKTQQKK